MRRLLSLLLTVLLLAGLVPAVAPAEENDARAMALQLAELAIAELKEEITEPWAGAMLAGAAVSGTEEKKSSVLVHVTVPTLCPGVKPNEKAGEDVAAWLKQAFQAYVDRTQTMDVTLEVKVSEKDGRTAVSWGGNGKNRLKSALRTQAANTKKNWTGKNLKAALTSGLLPKAFTWPKKQPETVPEAAKLTAWTSGLKEPMGLSEAQCEQRFSPFLLLTSLTKLEVDGLLDHVKVTLRLEDWEKMLERAETEAEAVLDTMSGVPDLPRERLEEVLCARLNEAAMRVHYRKTKVHNDITLDTDLPAAVLEGPAAWPALLEVLTEYNQALEKTIDTLAAYAAKLPYYVRVPEMMSTLLTVNADYVAVTDTLAHEKISPAEFRSIAVQPSNGDKAAATASASAAREDGGMSAVEAVSQGYTPVQFTGGDMELYVALTTQDGTPVMSGYAKALSRVSVYLRPDTYRVLWSRGPEWFGEDVLFGREADCGEFDLDVSGTERLIVSVLGEEGLTELSEMTWEDLMNATDPVRNMEHETVYYPNTL